MIIDPFLHFHLIGFFWNCSTIDLSTRSRGVLVLPVTRCIRSRLLLHKQLMTRYVDANFSVKRQLSLRAWFLDDVEISSKVFVN